MHTQANLSTHSVTSTPYPTHPSSSQLELSLSQQLLPAHMVISAKLRNEGFFKGNDQAQEHDDSEGEVACLFGSLLSLRMLMMMPIPLETPDGLDDGHCFFFRLWRWCRLLMVPLHVVLL